MSAHTTLFAFLCLFVACASALSTPHIAHNVHLHRRHAVMPRNPHPVAEPAAVEPRSSLRRRCKPRPVRSSSFPAAQPATKETDDQQSTKKEDVKTETPQPVATQKPTEQPKTETPKETSTKKAEDPKPTSQSSGGSSGSGSSSGGHPTFGILDGTNTGDATFYDPALGSCGITNSDSDLIVAVSHELFDTFPGYQGGNPNNNPICNKKIKANIDGKSITVTVTDRCVGCQMKDLDFSPAAFNAIADPARGRIAGMTWTWA